MIKTIGELKKAIANIDDDFTIDTGIVRELSEEELKGSRYPYPYEYSKANLQIGDIGYSDKDVFINIEEISDDVCEWKIFDNSLTDEPQWVYETACGKYVGEEHTSKAFVYCPYCSKKIKVVE